MYMVAGRLVYSNHPSSKVNLEQISLVKYVLSLSKSKKLFHCAIKYTHRLAKVKIYNLTRRDVETY